jgi:hypothetical protein
LYSTCFFQKLVDNTGLDEVRRGQPVAIKHGSVARWTRPKVLEVSEWVYGPLPNATRVCPSLHAASWLYPTRPRE